MLLRRIIPRDRVLSISALAVSAGVQSMVQSCSRATSMVELHEGYLSPKGSLEDLVDYMKSK